MVKTPGFFISAALVSLLLLSCGGAESYKTPLVYPSGIIQSECRPAESTEDTEESYEISVEGKDVVVIHRNILAPRNTTMGIIDRDGEYSYEGKKNYYYLEAGEQFISLQESFRHSSSEENCYYDLKTIVTHISGGIYDFIIFNENNEQVFTQEVRIR